MAELVTLTGDYNYHIDTPSRYNRRGRVNERNEELMGDLGDFFKSAGKFIASPFTAIGKGLGHATMEMYRGIRDGNFTRFISAPFKGIGHTGMEAYRDTKEHAEYYWRPSKMKDWMKPVGGAVLAIGAIPGPHSIIMVPLGSLLVMGGSIGETLYINDQIEKAEEAQKIQDLADQKKANYIWYGVGAIGAIGAYMVFT